MRLFSLFLIACCGFCLTASAQNVDVNSVVADPMTFTFNDGKHTVHGYVYSMLEKSTSCCGNDAIYLEVVFDQSGRVTSTKTLTGKNDCYKQSVKDVIRNVRWDAAGVKSSKTIYFEVKPIIPCSGSGNENVYKPVPLTLGDNSGAVVDNSGNDDVGTDDTGWEDNSGDDDLVMDDDNTGDDMTGDDDITGDDMTGDDDVAVDDMMTGDDNSSAGDDDGFLSEDGDVADVVDDIVDNSGTDDETAHDDGWANMYDDNSGNDNDTEDVADDVSIPETGNPDGATNRVSERNSRVSLPGQADYNYSSTGNKDPDDSHADTFKNVPGPTLATPVWANDESRVAVLIKQSLRRNGVCGLAQSLIELTLDPQGNVVNHNILKTNSDQVSKLLPAVLKEVKFKPQPQARFNYVTYIQFKTDIMCQTEAKRQPIDLDTVQDYIIIDK